MIKAIETEYNGYRFRSRLEARWAVFFDRAGIKYQYEVEGFEAVWAEGTYDEEKQEPTVIEKKFRYLPDFYLPDFDLWVEVKPNKEMLLEDSEKICACLLGDTQLSNSKGLIILGQIPYFNPQDEENSPAFVYLWNLQCWDDDSPLNEVQSGHAHFIAGNRVNIVTDQIPYGNTYDLEFPDILTNDDLVYLCKGYSYIDDFGIIWSINPYMKNRSAYYLTEWFEDARKARFEYGEHGNGR